MKKLTLLFLSLILLTGCGSSQKKYDKEHLNLYTTYWKSLINETAFQTSSRNFDIQVEMVKEVGEDDYTYYISVDKPKIAMYDVQIVVVENKATTFNTEDMLPSAGIFEKEFHLIPNQVKEDSQFKEGAILARQGLKEPSVKTQVLVTWKNFTRLESFKEVFEFDITYQEPEPEPASDAEGED
ncbi:MAG: hypothetical protein GX038_06030 [Erysipelothrix sp.]|nr:hypothetical protein [Erysipelothrix sp.]